MTWCGIVLGSVVNAVVAAVEVVVIASVVVDGGEGDRCDGGIVIAVVSCSQEPRVPCCCRRSLLIVAGISPASFMKFRLLFLRFSLLPGAVMGAKDVVATVVTWFIAFIAS